MGMTMAEKILANHSTPHKDVVKPGEFVTVHIDTVGLYNRPIPETFHKNKKGTNLNLRTLLYMVPRDKIELPTRGFSDQIFKNSKIS